MNNKITLFENIYYWIWYYIPKPQRAKAPSFNACILLSVSKVLNIICCVIILCTTLKVNIVDILGEKIIAIIAVAIIGFILFTDEKFYENRLDSICKKMIELRENNRKRKRIIFLCYMLITVIITLGAYIGYFHSCTFQ